MLVVHHFGPDTGQVGGMESVIRVLEDYQLGADQVVAHATQSRASHLASLRMTIRAVGTLLRLHPPGTVVHVHLSERGSFVREGLLLWLARRRGIPTVATNHGSLFVEFAGKHPRLVAYVLRQAQAIMCLSAPSLEVARELAPAVPSYRVCNPVPADPGSPPADQTDEVVLFAGEVGERKGADVLARAWTTVAARRTHARCVLIGPSTDLTLACQDRMEIRPPVPPDELRALLRSARVVVLPSRREAMPMILTEALAAGRPFVSTPIAGIPDLANGVQPLVPVGDSAALADRITELLADPALAGRLGEAGRRFHATTRSVEAVGPTLRAIYESVLADDV